MTGLEFAATLVRASVDILIAFAWPVAGVTIALIFKREIHRLLSDLRSFKMGPVDAHFRQEMNEAQAIATEISIDSALDGDLIDDSGMESSIKLDQLAMSAHPTGVIMESWKAIEGILENIAAKYQLVDPSNPGSPFHLERTLLKNKLINKEEAGLLSKMKHLRNQAAHSRDIILSSTDVAEYLQLALTTEKFLTRLLRAQTPPN